MASTICPDPDWNVDYVRNVLCGHAGDNFMKTCCEITAKAIFWKSGLKLYRDEDNMSIRTMEKKSSRFMIIFGHGDHYIAVFDGWLWQSYFNQYTVRGVPLTDDLRDAIDGIWDNENGWYKVTGVRETHPLKDKITKYFLAI